MSHNHSISILICDDDFLSSQLVGLEAQKSMNANFHWVPNVSDALESLRVAQFDILITELYLPGKSAIELVQSLRGEGCEIPVLVLSSHLTDEEYFFLNKVGVDDFISKPFNAAELQIRVQKLVKPQMTAS